eukprot:7103769-Pyramimonas_sp.AAC.1
MVHVYPVQPGPRTRRSAGGLRLVHFCEPERSTDDVLEMSLFECVPPTCAQAGGRRQAIEGICDVVEAAAYG